MNQQQSAITLSIRRWLVFFMIALVISGATAFDVYSGIVWIINHVQLSWAHDWLATVYEGIVATNQQFPFLFYGYDWMAFAHIVIAISFIGPYKDPLKNEWTIQFGMIACALILPVAFVFGHIRHIPLWWQLLDCCFGLFGFIPLWIVWNKIQQLKKLISVSNLSAQQFYPSRSTHKTI